MALSLIRLHNQFFTISQNCCFFLVLQWWRNKCLKACCEHQAARLLCIQGGWVLIIHEVIWHNQSPLIQVFVSGKLFFLLCMQHTATNLSSTLRLLFYASSVHVISASSYLFLHLQAGHKYKFWLLWRLKKENFCSNAIVSNQHWGVRAGAEPLWSFQQWAVFITNSNALQWFKAPSFPGAVAWKHSPGNSGIKVNYQSDFQKIRGEQMEN